ncbi:MAG: MFS transporter [Anaerolineae bacterium]|uniref:MFS transporter n=1 Tax=Candidatus Amarolinea dominans TaxID=3140696 RepID=UPI003135BBC4|nr:MFS transporter [Anaerolineae bacterium]
MSRVERSFADECCDETIVHQPQRWAWYLYDFANSSYAAVVLLAVYSAYFKNEVVGGAEGTRLWGLSISIAMIVVAILSPFLGAIADFSASKKRFLLIFTSITCAFTSLLFFVQKGDIVMGMIFFILAEIGYRSAQVFYNALLTEIAAPAEIGRFSSSCWRCCCTMTASSWRSDFAAIIGAVLFGMNQTMLIVFVIIVQVTNVVGAYFFGILADRYGCKRTLTLSISAMILVVIWLYFNQTQTGFLIIGAFAGIAMAGVRSVSRTMVGALTPRRRRRVLRLLFHCRAHLILHRPGRLRLAGRRSRSGMSARASQ